MEQYRKNEGGKKQNTKVIYNNDPNAIEKLEKKINKLEEQKEKMKLYDYEQWQLTNIKANIRETKLRLERVRRSINNVDI